MTAGDVWLAEIVERLFDRTMQIECKQIQSIKLRAVLRGTWIDVYRHLAAV